MKMIDLLTFLTQEITDLKGEIKSLRHENVVLHNLVLLILLLIRKLTKKSDLELNERGRLYKRWKQMK